MSVGSVIKYSMTLDGAQYMQELRRAVAETKAAEQAIKSQSREMGVITVTQDGVRKAMAASTAGVGKLSSGMGTALVATRSFNAGQSALTQAMNGNFIGAMRSGTVAANGFKNILAGSVGTFALAAAGVAAIAGAVVWMIHEYKKAESASERLNESLKRGVELRAEFDAGLAKAAGTDAAGLQSKEDVRIVTENDSGAARAEISSAKAALEEKKRMMDEFIYYRVEADFKGESKAAKAQAEIDKKRLAEEGIAAQERVKIVEGMIAQINAAKRAAYLRDVELLGKETAERNKAIQERHDAEYQAILDAGTAVAKAREKKEADDKRAADREAEAMGQFKERRDAYLLSKKPVEKQLDAVNEKIAGTIKGPHTAATGNKLLDLYEQRDRLRDEMRRAKEAEDRENRLRKSAMDADESRAARDAEAKTKGPDRESGRTATGFHVNAKSRSVRRMENSTGMLSGLNPSNFRKWSTKDGGPKEDELKVSGIDKSNSLLETIAKRLE